MIETTRRRVLSGEQVKLSSQPVRVGGPETAAADNTNGTIGVREIRDASGDISEIHIQCECGKTVIIQCDYPA